VSTKLGRVNGIQAVGAAIGVILGALYMLSVTQKLFFGPITKRENKHLTDVNGREIVALVPLTIMIFVIGFFPNIFLSQIKDAAERVQADLQTRITAAPAPEYYTGPIRLLPRKPEATPVVVTAAAPASATNGSK